MYHNGERSMAWIAKIDQVETHANADSLDICTVGGWRVVCQRGEYQPGDLAVYCSIDSWIPHELAPFLSKGSQPREYGGVLGNRLRTIKLRGEVSQGLLLPLEPTCNDIDTLLVEGLDVSAPLNIQKWEAPVPAQLAGTVRGNFPSFIPKTDQERIQNLSRELSAWQQQGAEWEVTEKLDGSSMTVYIKDGEVGVCSRNLDLLETDDNTLWRVARSQGLIDALVSTGRNLALQGELIGEGIQGNPYKFSGQQFYLYDIYDIDNARYLRSDERMDLTLELDVFHVPNLGVVSIQGTLNDLLEFAEGKSLLNEKTEREGLVYKHTQEQSSFKVISNRFLIKSGG